MPSVAYQSALGFSSPGNPGSSYESAWKRKNLVKATAVKVVKTLWVHRAVVTEFNALCMFLQSDGNKLGERIDDWGFANRPIRGSTSSSYHRFGLAIDVDATENPMGVRDTSFNHHNKVRRVCKLLGLRWGLDYSGRPDPMHFEFTKSRARAKYIRSRLVKPTKRSRELAKLCDMSVHEFCRRVNDKEDYPG
jgi:hypothetical protein